MKTTAGQVTSHVLLPAGTIPAGIHTPTPGLDISALIGTAKVVITSTGTYTGAGLQAQLQESADNATWAASTAYGTIFDGTAPRASSPQGATVTTVLVDTERMLQYVRPRLVSTGNFGLNITVEGVRGSPS